MKKILFILLILAAMLVFAGCKSTTDEGTVYFTISDPGFMAGVTSVEVTINEVSVNHVENGWTTVTTEPTTYDLVELDAAQAMELIEEVELENGTYTEVRLGISQVRVMKNGVEQDAVLPSDKLKIKSQFTVRAGEPTLVEFQFMGGESLHETGEGKIVMTPVVNMHRYENADVEKGEQNQIKVTTQARKETEQFGMNLEGAMEKGKKIAVAEELEIDAAGKIKKKGQPPEVTTDDEDSDQEPGTGQGSGDGDSDSDEDMPGTGNVVFTITDAQAELNVTSLEITISKLEVHKSVSDDESDEPASWITIFEENMTYELLELVDMEALLGETELDAGHYTQIRLYVTAATAMIDGEEVQVIVSSNALKLVQSFWVENGETTVVSIDFIPGKSLQSAGSGVYRLKPTIKLTVYKDAEVEVVEEEVEDTEEEEEPECDEGLFCIDDMTAAYQLENCTITNTTTCDYLCEDGVCIEDPNPINDTNTTGNETVTCTAGWYCVESTKMYQEEDCTWREEDSVVCRFGCLDGECKAKPKKKILAVEISNPAETIEGEEVLME